MATPSSSKKIQRVQRAGVNRSVGQRRPLGYPALIAGIIVVGCVLVWLARDARIHGDGERPRAGRDTWYQAYGTYECDGYLANLLPPATESDIEAMGNGVIIVGPSSEETAGRNATLGRFFEAQGMEVTDDSVTFADGTELKAGATCGDGDDASTDTVIKLFVWPPQASDRTKPTVVDADFASVRFEQNGAAFALALVDKDTDSIDLPGAVDNLSNPDAGAVPRNQATTTIAPASDGDAEGTVQEGSGDAGADDAETGADEADPGADATTTTAGN